MVAGEMYDSDVRWGLGLCGWLRVLSNYFYLHGKVVWIWMGS